MSSSFGSSLNRAACRHGGGVSLVVVAAASTAATGILLIGVPTIRLIALHARLDKAVTNFWSAGPYAREAAARSSRQALLPEELVEGSGSGKVSDEHRIFYDVSTKSVCKDRLDLGLDYEELLTKYLRHAMLGLQGFPQAWVLWLVAGRQGGRETFDGRHVQKLRFEAGDVVNGFYTVLGRDGNVVVFKIRSPGGLVEGRLVISIDDETERLDATTGAWVALVPPPPPPSSSSSSSPSSSPSSPSKVGDAESYATGKAKTAVVKSETFMWVRKAEGVLIPLERRVPRWLHEVASWWVMDEGTKWLATTATRRK